MQTPKAVPLLLLAAFCAAALLLSACQPREPVRPPEEVTRNMLQEASQALEQQEYEQAQELYVQALQQEEITDSMRLEAYRGVVQSAIPLQDYELAEQALQNWRTIEPQAPQTWSWQESKASLVKARETPQEYVSYLNSLVDEDRTWAVIFPAGRELTQHYADLGQPEEIFAVQQELYELAEEKEQRKELIHYFRGFLADLPPRFLQEAAEASPAEKAQDYPHILVRWENSLLLFQQEEEDWVSTWRMLSSMLSRAKPEIRSELEEDMQELVEEHGRPALGVALLLPLNGGHGAIGWDILLGADAAQWEMTRQGMEIEVRVINTSSRDWLEQLEDLPRHYSIVGGPLRGDPWESIHEAGLHEEFLFFAFRPQLGSGSEGEDAYRFFPSREDQARTLVEFAREELDIESFGALYPRNSFGRSMSREFWNATLEGEGELKALGWYTPTEITSWNRQVSDFLDVPEDYGEEEKVGSSGGNATEENNNATEANRNATQIPEPEFEALFLPDSFERARILIPEFFYFEQSDLVFLGPTIWEQHIEDIQWIDTRYFRLAVMAGAWWPENPSPQKRELEGILQEFSQEGPCFWSALGYDFLRLAGRLGQDVAVQSKEEVNEELAAISGDFGWSMAPISWDETGRASQDLYVLQPLGRGVELVDPESLRSRLQEIREREEEGLTIPGAERQDPVREILDIR